MALICFNIDKKTSSLCSYIPIASDLISKITVTNISLQNRHSVRNIKSATNVGTAKSP